jgi:small subunit ribosomal protein S13
VKKSGKKASGKRKLLESKGIKRIGGKDVPGEFTIREALLQIKGFGHTLSKVVADYICKTMQLNKNAQIGDLSDEQLEQIEHIITHLHETEIPKFLLNRRKDFREGKDLHLIMNDLIFAMQRDIEREKEIGSWRGFRHMYGQKVRGQRTKNTGRFGMTVGVVRKGAGKK